MEAKLLAGEEWTHRTSAWCFVSMGSGAANWIQRNSARRVSEGELVVIPPHQSGRMRALGSAPTRLAFFYFSDATLENLLGPEQRHLFEIRAKEFNEAAQFVSSNRKPALLFFRICNSPDVDLSRQRRGMLKIIAEFFSVPAGRLRKWSSPPRHQARFEDFIARMPEAEMMSHSSENLARSCQCSVRHFTRMFRSHFGVSLRAKQTAFRLRRARELLNGTNTKIVNVAIESGFRHIALFNFIFKKHLGMTPSQWRREQVRKRGAPDPARRSA